MGPVVDVGATDSNGVHPQQNLFDKVAMQKQPQVWWVLKYLGCIITWSGPGSTTSCCSRRMSSVLYRMAVKLSWRFLEYMCIKSLRPVFHLWCHVEGQRQGNWVSKPSLGWMYPTTYDGSILSRAAQPWNTDNKLSKTLLCKPARPNWFLLRFKEYSGQWSTQINHLCIYTYFQIPHNALKIEEKEVMMALYVILECLHLKHPFHPGCN